MLKKFPLQEDLHFEKLKFRHSEKLSVEVYERMDKGRLVFPNEGLSGFTYIINEIKNGTYFTEEDFEHAFEICKYFSDKKECKKVLSQSNLFKKPIIIGTNPSYVLRNRHKELLKTAYTGFSIEKEYGINLNTRWIFISD